MDKSTLNLISQQPTLNVSRKNTDKTVRDQPTSLIPMFFYLVFYHRCLKRGHVLFFSLSLNLLLLDISLLRKAVRKVH